MRPLDGFAPCDHLDDDVVDPVKSLGHAVPRITHSLARGAGETRHLVARGIEVVRAPHHMVDAETSDVSLRAGEGFLTELPVDRADLARGVDDELHVDQRKKGPRSLCRELREPQ